MKYIPEELATLLSPTELVVGELYNIFDADYLFKMENIPNTIGHITNFLNGAGNSKSLPTLTLKINKTYPLLFIASKNFTERTDYKITFFFAKTSIYYICLENNDTRFRKVV